MVKKVHLQPYLTSSQLKNRYLGSSDRVESRRWHLLWLVSKNWTIQQASQAVGLNYDYAKDIVKAYNQLGEKAIANRRRQRAAPPPHALLNREQLEELRCCLKEPPEDKGIWTGPKVADWIAKKTGREKVVVPEGIYLEPLPAYSPKLQPAERLWQLSDEPLVNKSFETLDELEEVLAERCCIVSQMRSQVQALTNYHWWPDSQVLETG